MRLDRERRRIVSDFVAAQAITPDRAIRYRAGADRTFRRMRGYGAIVEGDGGRYHLDVDRLRTFRGAVRRRLAAIAAAFGVVASALAAVTVFVLAE